MINKLAIKADKIDSTLLGLSTPKLLLHLEGFALLATALFLYTVQGFAWSTFFLLILAPDLAIIPYLVNKKVGAFAYNVLHTITLPLALVATALAMEWRFGIQIALIWLAHIGVDRTIGYGLKYVDSFKSTHLHKV